MPPQARTPEQGQGWAAEGQQQSSSPRASSETDFTKATGGLGVGLGLLLSGEQENAAPAPGVPAATPGVPASLSGWA